MSCVRHNQTSRWTAAGFTCSFDLSAGRGAINYTTICLFPTTSFSFYQVYKGPDTSYSFTNFQTNCEYRFRVCAARQYQDANGLQELYGPNSPSTTFSSQRQELDLPCANATSDVVKIKKKPLSDEQFAFLLLLAFALVAFLFAIIIQYFVIK